MTKYDWPEAPLVDVKDKQRSSPVAWVLRIGQRCDRNPVIVLIIPLKAGAAVRGHPRLPFVPISCTVPLYCLVHLRLQIFLHTDGLTYSKAHFTRSVLFISESI